MTQLRLSIMLRYALGGALLCGLLTSAIIWICETKAAEPTPTKAEPQQLFTRWPSDRQPELVLVLTGQMYGYVQKCGCSNPQKGGLERRFNFIESLKAKGWEVVGLDLGDLPKPHPYTPTVEQTRTKYEFGMKALQMMNYRAIGLGKEEMALPTVDALAKYAIQPGNEYPKILAANVTNRQAFPGLHDAEIVTAKSGLTVGVISVAGMELIQRNVDNNLQFGNTAVAVTGILDDWKKAGKTPTINVMLYQGPFDWKDPKSGVKADAQTAAAGFKDFHIILCKTPDDSDAPNEPTRVNDGATMICQVGQKGQSVGLIGVFRGAKGLELYYQRVIMTDEFETSPEKEKNNAMLKLLQEYSDTVKGNDYLSEMAKRKTPLPKKGDAFVGDQQCFVCHQNEWTVYSKSKHSHAYEALEKLAKHPTGRNFDGECIICHTVGYDRQTGYVNEKTTPHLKNVQCESCHGPAKLHVDEEIANAKKKANQQTHVQALALSPWKTDGKGALPSLEKLEAHAAEKDYARKEKMLTPSENQTYLAVYQVCAKCHDIDNDPKFDLSKYWKNIAHTGLNKKGK